MIWLSIAPLLAFLVVIWVSLNARLRGRQWLDRHSDLIADLDVMLDEDSYTRHSDLRAWEDAASTALDELPLGSALPTSRLLLGKETAHRVSGVLTACERVRDHNEEYVKSKLEAPVFDTLLDRPLTHEQRSAILKDEDALLVIAGAGTGKTATLVGKVGYLIHEGVRPEEILVLTFLKKVREELRHRIENLGIEGCERVCISNIHKFANRVISEKEGGLRSVSDLAGDEEGRKQRSEFIQTVLDHLLRDDSRSSAWRFLLYDLPSPLYLGEGKKSEDYWLQWRKCHKRTLKGKGDNGKAEYVRSREELMIADFLFSMGVEYEYEKLYEVDTRTPEHRQYKPDFFLPKKQLYIEHFGLGPNDEPPPFFTEEEKKRYLRDCNWKIKTHRDNGTIDRLVRTFSRDARDGILLEKLERELKSHGVTFDPLSPEVLMQSEALRPRISALSELLSVFLELYKEGNWSIDRVLARARKLEHEDRMRRFLCVFRPVYEAYEVKLTETAEIDFADMLNMASECLESGAVKLRFRYCLVDEFQDVTPGIVRFLCALQSQEAKPHLFCIGDDWQSIYRFRGGDVSYIAGPKSFEEHFGFHERLKLTRTFRLNDRLEDFTSTFIMKNESQGEKRLETEKKAATTSARVLLVSDSDGRADYRSGAERALSLISKQKRADTATVLVLDRYKQRYARRRSPGVDLGIRDFMRTHRGTIQVEFSTIHGSKGLERDFVILVGLENDLGPFSFPSSFSDDPALAILLARPESFPHAEERRLLYVAATRAREAVYMVAPQRHPSVFISEIARDEFDVQWLDELDSKTLPQCEICSVGVIHLWQGVSLEGKQLRNYWECDLCGARPNRASCPSCEKGMVKLLKGTHPPYASKCPSCGHVVCTRPERRGNATSGPSEKLSLDLQD